MVPGRNCIAAMLRNALPYVRHIRPLYSDFYIGLPVTMPTKTDSPGRTPSLQVYIQRIATVNRDRAELCLNIIFAHLLQ